MERFIADLVKNFEAGKMDRREFCQTVALAANVYAAGDAARAQTSTGFKVLGINHFSYTCPDYRKPRISLPRSSASRPRRTAASGRT